MKLITEEIQKVEFITEGKGSQKKMYIEGVFLQGDICNRNGRMYPMETLSREVKRYTESFIDKGRALGELGHPDGPTVNLDRVSHKIVSLTSEGTNFRGKVKLAKYFVYIEVYDFSVSEDEVVKIKGQSKTTQTTRLGLQVKFVDAESGEVIVGSGLGEASTIKTASILDGIDDSEIKFVAPSTYLYLIDFCIVFVRF